MVRAQSILQSRNLLSVLKNLPFQMLVCLSSSWKNLFLAPSAHIAVPCHSYSFFSSRLWMPILQLFSLFVPLLVHFSVFVHPAIMVALHKGIYMWTYKEKHKDFQKSLSNVRLNWLFPIDINLIFSHVLLLLNGNLHLPYISIYRKAKLSFLMCSISSSWLFCNARKISLLPCRAGILSWDWKRNNYIF